MAEHIDPRRAQGDEWADPVVLRMVAAAERTAQCLAELTELTRTARDASARSEQMLSILLQRVADHDDLMRGAVEAQARSDAFIRDAMTPWFSRLWRDFKQNPIPFVLVVMMLTITILVTVGPLRVSVPVGSGGTIESRQPAAPTGAQHQPTRSD